MMSMMSQVRSSKTSFRLKAAEPAAKPSRQDVQPPPPPPPPMPGGFFMSGPPGAAAEPVAPSIQDGTFLLPDLWIGFQRFHKMTSSMLSPEGLPTRHIGLDGQARPHTSTPARAARAASALSGSPSWLLGSVTREEMNAKLALMGLQEGQFLVRTLPLSLEECRYAFAIVHRGKPTLHMCVKAPDGIFTINNKRYGEPRSLGELVATLSAAELPSGWPVRLVADGAGSSSSLPALDLHSAAVLLFEAPKLRLTFADLVMQRLIAAGMRSLAPADIQATLFLASASLVLRFSEEFMLVKPDDTPAVHDYVICDVSNDNPIVGIPDRGYPLPQNWG